MGKAPVFERVNRRPPPPLDVGDDFDRGSDAGARRHPSPSRMRTMKITHITASTTAPAPNKVPRLGT